MIGLMRISRCAELIEEQARSAGPVADLLEELSAAITASEQEIRRREHNDQNG
jgi:hypothetical protein